MYEKLLLTVCLGVVQVGLSAGTTRAEHETRLVANLFHNYNKDVIPVEETGKPVDVKAGIALIQAEPTADSKLNIEGWFRMVWHDYRLKWNAEDYGNITVIRTNVNNLWIPDLTIYNAINRNDNSINGMTKRGVFNALVYPNGEVLLIPPFNEQVFCDEDNSVKWPFEELSCHIKIGSWTYDGFLLDLSQYNSKGPNKNCVDLTDYAESSRFFLTENSCKGEILETKYYPCCAEPYQSLTYRLKLQAKYRFDEEGDLEGNNDLIPAFKTAKDDE